MAQLRATRTLASGHTITLAYGDLTEEQADAIVNAANTMLAHLGGVAGAIVRKGGQTIQEESFRAGRVPTGGAAITGAGTLPAQFVIHAVGPVWSEHSPEENDRLLASATTSALEIAREKGLASIAFPPISSGIFGFPKDRCARVMLAAVAGWAASHPDASPREIRFTLIPAEVVDLYEAEMARQFP